MTTTRYFSLGRHAIKDALRYAGVDSGDYVLLPSFICRDLLSSVAELGAKTVFYEVDTALKPVRLDPKIGAKVIVAVNYFGFAQNLEPYNEYCKQTGAIIVEDNAHGFLSRDENNNLLGTRTKFGITSFRKSLRVQDGAILTTSLNDQEIDKQLDYIDSPVSKRNSLLRLLSSVESRTNIPAVAIGQSISRAIRFLRTGSGLPKTDPNAETTIPGLANPHLQSVTTLEALDGAREVSRRRNLYQTLKSQVVATGATLIFADLPENTCPYGLPVYANEESRRNLAKVARQNRVTLMNWPDLPNSVIVTAPGFYKRVWLLNFQ